jgi:RNA polymerase sigma-B factor
MIRPAGSLTFPDRPGQSACLDDLFARWHTSADPAAREELCHRFLPLARRLANRYRNAQEPIEDLIQVASLGLLGAIDRFDPDRGISFTAFAVPTILGELKRHFRNTGWATHVPRGAQELALRVTRAAQQIARETGRPVTVTELAEYLEISLEDVLIGLDAGGAQYSISLDAPSSGGEVEEPQPLVELLGHDDDGYGVIESQLSLTVALTRLPHLERQAMQMRIEHDMKQSEIASALGCSQMQVSRLLRRAVSNLRHQIDPKLAGSRPTPTAY